MDTIQTFIESVEQVEKISETFPVFNATIHSFLNRLKNQGALKSYSVIYNDANVLHIIAMFSNGKQFNGSFTYDKELYNGGSN